MSIECGFFNSVNKDRLYSADMMTRPYELLVSNGVFATPQGTPSTHLQVVANGGMRVTVKAGRGIFKDKWLINNTDLALTLSASEVALRRIDSIVVRIDTSESVRAGTIKIKKGTPASNPVAPTMTRTSDIHEYRLADILVKPQATNIAQADITDQRGSSDCPWVTSLINQMDTSTLFLQWQQAYNKFYSDSNVTFNKWFKSLKETVATQTLIRTFESYYITSAQNETVIPIQIVQYNNELDILQVHINGLKLIENVDYTIASVPASQITLVKPLEQGQMVNFVVYKSVDGSSAETVLEQVEELQTILDRTKITTDTGGVKLSVTSTQNVLNVFTSQPVGAYTIYTQYGASGVPVAGAYRMFGHLTATGYGWLFAMKADGSTYVNCIDNGAWQGWKALFEVTPTALFSSTSGTFPIANGEIVPTKPLAQCQHGWELVFCGYDDSTNTAKDSYVQTIHIPKKSHKNAVWNGERMTYALAYNLDNTTGAVTMCAKTFQIYPTKIVSGATNSVGLSRNMVLKAIYEY